MRTRPFFILWLLLVGSPLLPHQLRTCVLAQITVPCGETFYDGGGANGNYDRNEFEEYSICPTSDGLAATITFTELDINTNCDRLTVYNGTFNNPIGTVTAAGVSFTSTWPDGCLLVSWEAATVTPGAGFTVTTDCRPPPVCPAPVNLFVNSATTTSFELAWEEAGSALTYDLFVTPAGTPPGATPDYASVTSPYQVAGLTPGTDYDIYLVADCTTDGQSGRYGPNRVSTVPPPPANDICPNAVNLAVTTEDACDETTFYSLRGATTSNPTANTCADSDEIDAYFSFVATTPSATVRLGYECTLFEGDSGANVEIFSGSCNNLSSLGCQRRVTNLEIGTTYYIRVSQRAFFSVLNDFSVCVIAGEEPPVNDDCDEAINLIVANSNTCNPAGPFTTLGATQSQINTCGGTADDDVWFTFTASAPDQFLTVNNVEIVNDAFGRDVYYEVFSGSCGTLTSVACGEIRSFVTEPATINGLLTGQMYFLRIYSENNPNQITFDICLATAPPPPEPPVNNDCAGSIPLPLNDDAECGETVTGTFLLATRSGDDCGGGSAGKDVWYSFTATRETHLLSVIRSSEPVSFRFVNLFYELNEGGCGALTPLECDWASRFAVTPLTGLTVGREYLLRIFQQTDFRDAEFELCLGTPPINDECDAAITVPVNPDLTNTLTTAGTSFGGTTSYDLAEGETGCDNFANDDDVWYRFTALSDEQRVSILNAVPRNNARTSGTTTLAIVRIFDATAGCATPTELDCEFLAEDADEKVFSSLTPGQDYFLSVQTQGTRNDFEFDLSIKTETVTLPVQLLSFSGRTSPKHNTLRWEVATEENFSHYEVERSADGKGTWSAIGRVVGSFGSVGTKTYAFEDASAPARAYYRLRSIDLDGTYAVSTLVFLRRGAERLLAFPNPGDGRFSLSPPAGRSVSSVEVYDLSGRRVAGAMSAGDLPQLSAGVYLVAVDLEGRIERTRIVVR